MLSFKNFIFLLLVTSNYAANITCDFSGSPPSCVGFNLTPVIKQNEDITIVNAPFTPYTDNIRTFLYLSSTSVAQIQEFPRNLFNIFTAITQLRVYNISTTELGTDSFFNCANLTIIEFSRSNIGRLSAGFARICTNLLTLMIQDCKVGSIDANAFEGLTKLEKLYMERSQITYVPPTLIQTLKALIVFNLEYNSITSLDPQFFVGLPKLYSVSLNECAMCYIPNFNFTGTAIDIGVGKILQLILYSNPIKAINPQLLNSLQTKKLTGENQIYIYFKPLNTDVKTCVNESANDLFFIIGYYDSSFHGNFFENSTTCYSFNPSACFNNITTMLSTTSITETTPIIETSSTLSDGSSSSSTQEINSPISSSDGINTEETTSTLPPNNEGQCATDKICRYYLDWNNTYTCVIDGAEGTVTSISGTHFMSFTDSDLKRLYFINSRLSFVPNILFDKFPNLMYLHISNCGLNVINDRTFNKCGNLELLDASHNDIYHVDETALRNCTKLRIVDLTGNPIDYIGGVLYQLDPSLERIHLTRFNDWVLA